MNRGLKIPFIFFFGPSVEWRKCVKLPNVPSFQLHLKFLKVWRWKNSLYRDHPKGKKNCCHAKWGRRQTLLSTPSQNCLPYCHWYSECFNLTRSILSNLGVIQRTVFHLKECQGGKYTAGIFPNQKEGDVFLISESIYKPYFTDDIIFGTCHIFFCWTCFSMWEVMVWLIPKDV